METVSGVSVSSHSETSGPTYRGLVNITVESTHTQYFRNSVRKRIKSVVPILKFQCKGLSGDSHLRYINTYVCVCVCMYSCISRILWRRSIHYTKGKTSTRATPNLSNLLNRFQCLYQYHGILSHRVSTVSCPFPCNVEKEEWLCRMRWGPLCTRRPVSLSGNPDN